MHILIGIITAVAGLLWALNSLQRSGVDLNSFNPFTWHRRRKWEALYGAKPLLNLDKPLDAAGAAVLSLFAEEPLITKEQKDGTINLFKQVFELGDREANELFSSSAHLVKGEVNLHEIIPKILSPSLHRLTPVMKRSLLSLLIDVASLDGAIKDKQAKIIESASSILNVQYTKTSKWG